MRDLAISAVAIVAICYLMSNKSAPVVVNSAPPTPSAAPPKDTTETDVHILDTPHAELISQMANPVNQTSGITPAAVPFAGSNTIVTPIKTAAIVPVKSTDADYPTTVRGSIYSGASISPMLRAAQMVSAAPINQQFQGVPSAQTMLGHTSAATTIADPPLSNLYSRLGVKNFRA